MVNAVGRQSLISYASLQKGAIKTSVYHMNSHFYDISKILKWCKPYTGVLTDPVNN